MKVKSLIDCVGVGYELKKDDVTELEKELAAKLISFGYVEEVKVKRSART